MRADRVIHASLEIFTRLLSPINIILERESFACYNLAAGRKLFRMLAVREFIPAL